MAALISAHDNQTGLDLTSPPSTRGAAPARIFDVPLVRATAANLQGFGRPVADFASSRLDITPFPTSGWRKLVAGTGDEGGFVEDVFENERVGDVQFSVNVGLGRKYVTGWFGEDPRAAATTAEGAAPSSDRFILTHEANYHPDGGQIIASRGGGRFVLLLARAGDDVRPESFRAFLIDPSFDGTVGVHIDAGTWHQPAFPAALEEGDSAGAGRAVLDNRQGKVHACVAVSFVEEFGGYLRVPLARDLLTAAPPQPVSAAAPRLGYVILYVQDVAASIAFYASAFGLRKRMAMPVYGELETGKTTLALCATAHAATNFAASEPGKPYFRQASPLEPPHAVEVGIVVADVASAFARAVAQGASLASEPRTKPWGQVVAYVRDLDGHLVELCSALP